MYVLQKLPPLTQRNAELQIYNTLVYLGKSYRKYTDNFNISLYKAGSLLSLWLAYIARHSYGNEYCRLYI
jgi:hypothetical protein